MASIRSRYVDATFLRPIANPQVLGALLDGRAPPVGHCRFSELGFDLDQRLAAVPIPDLIPPLKLADDDPWMNADAVGEPDDRVPAVERDRSGDELLDHIVRHQAVCRPLIRPPLRRRLLVRRGWLRPGQVLVKGNAVAV